MVTATDEAEFPPSAFGKLTAELQKKINTQYGEDFEIPENNKVQAFIPEALKTADYLNKKDWNYNTLEATAQKFDLLRAKHPPLNAQKFWSAVMRGGIQAAVYVSDTIEKK